MPNKIYVFFHALRNLDEVRESERRQFFAALKRSGVIAHAVGEYLE